MTTSVPSILVAVLTVAAVFTIAPTSSAYIVDDCINAEGTHCVRAGGQTSGSGTCDSAAFYDARNTVSVNSYGSPLGWTSAEVSNGCQAFSFGSFEGSLKFLVVRAHHDNIALVSITWTDSTFNGNQRCEMGATVYVQGIGAHQAYTDDCPAGSPPMTPILP